MSEKVKLKFILASDPSAPYKTIQVPSNITLNICLKKVAEMFGMNPGTCGIISSKGIGVNQQLTAGAAFMTHGEELRIIPRDRVGFSNQNFSG